MGRRDSGEGVSWTRDSWELGVAGMAAGMLGGCGVRGPVLEATAETLKFSLMKHKVMGLRGD